MNIKDLASVIDKHDLDKEDIKVRSNEIMVDEGGGADRRDKASVAELLGREGGTVLS